MKKILNYIKHNWITISLLVLLIGLTIAIRVFIYSFEVSYFEGEFHRPDIRKAEERIELTDLPNAPAKKVQTNTPPPVSSIQAWMTFDYVNVVYKIPTSYMKDILGINNTKYPNLRIDTYAKQSGIDQTLLLNTVRHYISTYKAQ